MFLFTFDDDLAGRLALCRRLQRWGQRKCMSDAPAYLRASERARAPIGASEACSCQAREAALAEFEKPSAGWRLQSITI